ncbi:MAG: hypothetical protein QM809_04145 [Gordonia sp. (in: high G+C Gram-positive bacteria)]
MSNKVTVLAASAVVALLLGILAVVRNARTEHPAVAPAPPRIDS